MKNLLFFFAISFTIISCQQNQPENAPEEQAVSQDNTTGSGDLASQIADEVMEAMGGLDNWNNTNFLTWNFFGRRKHYWDKQTGNVRIEIPEENLIYLVNVITGNGRVQNNGEEITHPDSLKNYLTTAKSMWINDSYWLVMPFKLKDPGVHLKHLGEGVSDAGNPSDILELTFDGVGDTPQNKYHVMVDKNSRLITEWSFFSNQEDTDPRFTLPWLEYNDYGNIKLSGNRGRGQLTAIAVYENLPGKLFTEFDK